MIYKIIKTIAPQNDGEEPKTFEFEIDDTIFLNKQSKDIRAFVKQYRESDSLQCDNCRIDILTTGRMIITTIIPEE